MKEGSYRRGGQGERPTMPKPDIGPVPQEPQRHQQPDITSTDWVRAGIIAAKELNVPPDARIEFAPKDHDYVVVKVIEDRYTFVTCENDIVKPHWWRYQNKDGSIWSAVIGYSEKCNTLVIWPEAMVEDARRAK